MRGFGLQVEAVDRLLAQEHATGVPRHALVHQARADTEAVEDFQRALGEADRPRAGRQSVVVVEQQHRHLLLREVDRQGQAHRSGAHDHHGMTHRCGRILVGATAIREDDLLVIHRTRARDVRIPGPATSAGRARRSRCAVGIRRGLVVAARHVERHAVVEDHPVAVFGPELVERLLVDRVQVLAAGDAGLDAGPHVGDEVACALQAGGHLLGRGERGTATRHQRARLHRRQVVERVGPVLEVGVAGIRCGVELDQVAREQDLLLGQPGDGVALGVAAAHLQQLHLELAEPDAHRPLNVMVGHVMPAGTLSTLRNRRGKRADLARLVGLAALDDQVVGVAAGDDVLGLVARCTQHAHRVVVAEHDVLDRLVGHGADVADHVLRHHRRGLGVDHHHRIVADDDAGVGVALGGVGVGVGRQLAEGDLLVGEVGLRRECFGHRTAPRLFDVAPRAGLRPARPPRGSSKVAEPHLLEAVFG